MAGPRDPRSVDRFEAPAYLARYHERRGRETVEEDKAEDPSTPLYLRRFRSRQAAPPRQVEQLAPPRPVIQVEDEAFTREYAQASREKEIVAPPPGVEGGVPLGRSRRDVEQVIAEIRLVRHGITQGYSTDAGLTPMGGWQAHQRGHSLSKSLKDGERVRIVCADTSRARQTAAQIYRGMLDGLEQWQRKAVVSEPEPVPELRNFQVATPDGLRDVTSAFRQYQAAMERLERMAVGDRPRWLVEIDRFWRTQQGGADPIAMWMTIPLMYFEPPQSCVRRFWRGFQRLVEESPDSRIVAATHSGPMRAFATWAHGYDPGEPYNTEEIVVRLRRGGQTALVAYRNRVTEVNVPLGDEPTSWDA